MGPGASPGRRIACGTFALAGFADAIVKQHRHRHSLRDLAAHFARVLLTTSRPLRNRGRSATLKRGRRRPSRGAQGRPGARCTRGLACKGRKKDAHEHTGSAEAVRPSLRNGFNGLLRALPGDRLSCHRRPLRSLLLKNLTPASGRQDHTTSPSASRAVRQKRIRVHRIPPHVRDDRETPLVWDGTATRISR